MSQQKFITGSRVLILNYLEYEPHSGKCGKVVKVYNENPSEPEGRRWVYSIRLDDGELYDAREAELEDISGDTVKPTEAPVSKEPAPLTKLQRQVLISNISDKELKEELERREAYDEARRCLGLARDRYQEAQAHLVNLKADVARCMTDFTKAETAMMNAD
jgi:hypothetical protein